MVYRNNSYQAKPSFQSNKETLTGSDYITRKKRNLTCCSSNVTPYSRNYVNGSLNMNLFTTLNLTNVCVIDSSSNLLQCTTNLNYTTNSLTPFFENYTIDPNGCLFGNSQCGINNFQNYIVPNCSCV